MVPKRYTDVTVIVLMMNGQQRITQSTDGDVAGLMKRAFRDAINQAQGVIKEAVVVHNQGVQNYSEAEVWELAE